MAPETIPEKSPFSLVTQKPILEKLGIEAYHAVANPKDVAYHVMPDLILDPVYKQINNELTTGLLAGAAPFNAVLTKFQAERLKLRFCLVQALYTNHLNKNTKCQFVVDAMADAKSVLNTVLLLTAKEKTAIKFLCSGLLPANSDFPCFSLNAKRADLLTTSQMMINYLSVAMGCPPDSNHMYALIFEPTSYLGQLCPGSAHSRHFYDCGFVYDPKGNAGLSKPGYDIVGNVDRFRFVLNSTVWSALYLGYLFDTEIGQQLINPGYHLLNYVAAERQTIAHYIFERSQIDGSLEVDPQSVERQIQRHHFVCEVLTDVMLQCNIVPKPEALISKFPASSPKLIDAYHLYWKTNIFSVVDNTYADRKQKLVDTTFALHESLRQIVAYKSELNKKLGTLFPSLALFEEQLHGREAQFPFLERLMNDRNVLNVTRHIPLLVTFYKKVTSVFGVRLTKEEVQTLSFEEGIDLVAKNSIDFPRTEKESLMKLFRKVLAAWKQICQDMPDLNVCGDQAANRAFEGVIPVLEENTRMIEYLSIKDENDSYNQIRRVICKLVSAHNDVVSKSVTSKNLTVHNGENVPAEALAVTFNTDFATVSMEMPFMEQLVSANAIIAPDGSRDQSEFAFEEIERIASDYFTRSKFLLDDPKLVSFEFKSDLPPLRFASAFNPPEKLRDMLEIANYFPIELCNTPPLGPGSWDQFVQLSKSKNFAPTFTQSITALCHIVNQIFHDNKLDPKRQILDYSRVGKAPATGYPNDELWRKVELQPIGYLRAICKAYLHRYDGQEAQFQEDARFEDCRVDFTPEAADYLEQRREQILETCGQNSAKLDFHMNILNNLLNVLKPRIDLAIGTLNENVREQFGLALKLFAQKENIADLDDYIECIPLTLSCNQLTTFMMWICDFNSTLSRQFQALRSKEQDQDANIDYNDDYFDDGEKQPKEEEKQKAKPQQQGGSNDDLHDYGKKVQEEEETVYRANWGNFGGYAGGQAPTNENQGDNQGMQGGQDVPIQDANQPPPGAQPQQQQEQQPQGGHPNPQQGGQPQGGHPNPQQDGQPQGGIANPQQGGQPQGAHLQNQGGMQPQGGFAYPQQGGQPHGVQQSGGTQPQPQPGIQTTLENPQQGGQPQGGQPNTQIQDASQPQGIHPNMNPMSQSQGWTTGMGQYPQQPPQTSYGTHPQQGGFTQQGFVNPQQTQPPLHPMYGTNPTHLQTPQGGQPNPQSQDASQPQGIHPSMNPMSQSQGLTPQHQPGMGQYPQQPPQTNYGQQGGFFQQPPMQTSYGTNPQQGGFTQQGFVNPQQGFQGGHVNPQPGTQPQPQGGYVNPQSPSGYPQQGFQGGYANPQPGFQPQGGNVNPQNQSGMQPQGGFAYPQQGGQPHGVQQSGGQPQPQTGIQTTLETNPQQGSQPQGGNANPQPQPQTGIPTSQDTNPQPGQTGPVDPKQGQTGSTNPSGSTHPQQGGQPQGGQPNPQSQDASQPQGIHPNMNPMSQSQGLTPQHQPGMGQYPQQPPQTNYGQQGGFFQQPPMQTSYGTNPQQGGFTQQGFANPQQTQPLHPMYGTNPPQLQTQIPQQGGQPQGAYFNHQTGMWEGGQYNPYYGNPYFQPYGQPYQQPMGQQYNMYQSYNPSQPYNPMTQSTPYNPMTQSTPYNNPSFPDIPGGNMNASMPPTTARLPKYHMSYYINGAKYTFSFQQVTTWEAIEAELKSEFELDQLPGDYWVYLDGMWFSFGKLPKAMYSNLPTGQSIPVAKSDSQPTQPPPGH